MGKELDLFDYVESLNHEIIETEEIPKKRKMGKIKKVGYQPIAYKYKVKCSETTKKNIDDCLYLCRKLYNDFLQERIDAYKITRYWSIKRDKYPDFYSQKKILPLLKEYDERYKKYPSNIFQNVAERLNRSYQNFFRNSGFPEFKNRKKYNSFTMTYANGYSMDGKGSVKLRKLQTEYAGNYTLERPFIKISGIGVLKLLSYNERPIKGIINSVSVVQNTRGETWVVFSCDHIPEQYERTGEMIGIDVGINKYLALSDGSYIDNPKFVEKFRKKHRVLNRAMSRKKLYSNGWKLNAIQIANLKEKESNSRIDFQHKLSDYLVKKFDIITCEELKIKNMSASAKGDIDNPGKNVKQKSGLNRSILDGAFYRFFQMLKYKCERYGKTFLQVPPQNTSTTCNKCKNKDRENRQTQESFKCTKCGHEDNADTNAAKNIYEIGIKILFNE